MPKNREHPMQSWAHPWPSKHGNAAPQWYSQKRRDVGASRPIGRDDLPF